MSQNDNNHSAQRLSRRSFLKQSTVLAGAAAVSAASGTWAWSRDAVAGEKLSGPLRVSNWPYYISPKTVPAFEKKFGIQVDYIEDINDNASLFGKIAGPLQMGRNPGRDIIIPTDFLVARLIQLGWLEKFSHQDVPNAKNLMPRLQHPAWDPKRQYSLPWATYTTTIAYNIEKTGKELTSINDIYDPAYKGHVSMLSQMRDTLALVFLGMGVNPEEATYADVQKAVKKIEKNVRNGQIRQFFGNDYGAALTRGDIWVAFAWSGDIVQLQKDNPELRFVIPKEGIYRSDDNMVIPLQAAHRQAALAWMNFIYDPKVYAQIAAYIQYIPPVRGTEQYVKETNPSLLDNPLIYPTDAMWKKMYGFKALSAEQERKWQALFQSAIGH